MSQGNEHPKRTTLISKKRVRIGNYSRSAVWNVTKGRNINLIMDQAGEKGKTEDDRSHENEELHIIRQRGNSQGLW